LSQIYFGTAQLFCAAFLQAEKINPRQAGSADIHYGNLRLDSSSTKLKSADISVGDRTNRRTYKLYHSFENCDAGNVQADAAESRQCLIIKRIKPRSYD